MVDVDVGNIYITSGSISGNTITGGTTVQIQTTKIDYNYDNQIQIIPIPISSGNRDTKTNYARVIDIKRINESLAVQGFLIEETTERAITKRNNLLSLGKTGGELTVVWGQGSYQTKWESGSTAHGIFIQKMMFTETAGLMGVSFTGDAPPERSIAVQINLIRGKDM